MIELAVSAADEAEGMTLGELRNALDRILDAGAPFDGPVRVIVSRLHHVRRVECAFAPPTDDDTDDEPNPNAPAVDALT